MKKLRDNDYEGVIEASMLAGTHWLNFARHQLKFAGAEHDVMHAEYLDGVQRVKIQLLAPHLLAALDEIEGHRAGYVRGDLNGGERIAARCRHLLEQIRDIATKVTPLKPSPDAGPRPPA
ncbi:MAG TPA: hypothetical protein VFA58_09340 [Chthoniobacterales bacterium]|nr:hypothetical protein [Chthoniobacterales bacterium]